jgi:hypothetical protein
MVACDDSARGGYAGMRMLALRVELFERHVVEGRRRDFGSLAEQSFVFIYVFGN